ncbi:hypothetical protein K1719_044894 [Acacia pycnantha]|nr:hypothetical protein K1719_044894 [Acacia pycnantha]
MSTTQPQGFGEHEFDGPDVVVGPTECSNEVSYELATGSWSASTVESFIGFISIDCGASIDYVDEVTGIWYQRDESFIESGTNQRLAPNISFDHHAPTINRQLMTLRSFPEGERNCYTLRPKQEKQKQKYLMRAIIAYGNYDLRNRVPEFDLYLGVNYWTTFRILPITYAPQTIFPFEIIMEKDRSTEMIQVCLVNTGGGTPFINTLELRPLNNSLSYSSSPYYI